MIVNEKLLPPDTSTRTERPRRRWDVYLAAAVMLTIAHFCALAWHFRPVSNGPDANGYLVQARLLAEHGRTWFAPESPLQYAGMHWLSAAGGHLVSRYPPGVAILMAIAYKLVGQPGAVLLNLVLASLTLFGLFLVAWLWMGPKWALAAMAVMAVNPIANAWAFMGDAHPATAFFLVWGLYFVAPWARNPTALGALGCGLWLGIIPALRYSEALYLPAFGVFMLMSLRRARADLRPLMGAAVGALVPVALLLIHNRLLWGAFTGTGYDAGRSLFSWSDFGSKAIPYVQSLQSGVGLFAALGLAGMVYLCADRRTAREGWLLLLLVVPITLLYMAYFFYDNSMRFLMPTFYLYALGGVWLFQRLHDTEPKAAWAALGACLALTVVPGAIESIQSLSRTKASDESMARTTRALIDRVPAGAILIAPEMMEQHLDFVGRWRLADGALFGTGRFGPMFGKPGMGGPGMGGPGFGPGSGVGFRGRGFGGPGGGGPDGGIMQTLMQSDERRKIRERYASEGGESLSPRLLRDLSSWAGSSHPIYWLGDLDAIRTSLGDAGRGDVVAEIDAPAATGIPMGPMAGRGMGGPPAGGFPSGGPPMAAGPTGAGPMGAGPMGGPPMNGGPMGGPFMGGPFLGGSSTDGRLTLVRIVLTPKTARTTARTTGRPSSGPSG